VQGRRYLFDIPDVDHVPEMGHTLLGAWHPDTPDMRDEAIRLLLGDDVD
jgi:hypothetical protein